jgi:RecJ-like exonuclease
MIRHFHACDACGKEACEPDEYLCPNCKQKLKNNTLQPLWSREYREDD